MSAWAELYSHIIGNYSNQRVFLVFLHVCAGLVLLTCGHACLSITHYCSDFAYWLGCSCYVSMMAAPYI